jgi:uncharacterized membrane-anchored protein
MSNLFLGFTVIGCVMLVVFPLVVRRVYLRRRDRFPKLYWIASVIGLECEAIAAILVGLMGLSLDHMREAQFNMWFVSFSSFSVLGSIGLGISGYFVIRHAIRQIMGANVSDQ